MATPREVGLYPEVFRTLFLKAAKEPVEIHCIDPRSAAAYRGRLYAFREAILASMEEYPELTLIAPILTFELSGSKLIIHIKEGQI